jgi:uncharacterized membrane protein
VAYVAIPALLVAGIWLGFLGSYWGRLWIWVSLILLIGVGIAMTPLAAGPMRRVRKALGMQMGKPMEGEPAPMPLADAEVAGARAALKPELTAVIGVAALVVIIWMMVAKPF